MQSLMQNIIRGMLVVCSVIIFICIVAICYEVAVRAIFNRPTSWVVEVISYLFLWLALLSAAIAVAEDRQLRIDFIVNRLTGRARVIAEIATLLVILVTVVIYFAYGVAYFVQAYNAGWVHGWGRLYIPMAYTRAALPVVDGLLIFFLVRKIYLLTRQVLTQSDEQLSTVRFRAPTTAEEVAHESPSEKF